MAKTWIEREWIGVVVTPKNKKDVDELASMLAVDYDLNIKEAARLIGRVGGKSKSEAKIAAARENGKKGGRPRKAAKQFTLSSATS